MKIKAGRDLGIGGDVTEAGGDVGSKPTPHVPWYKNKTAAWLVVTLALIASVVIFYLVSGRVEVVFAELIGLALGYVVPRITRAKDGSG